jgi:diguanylate cyclase (GGDEF)-like protein
MQSAIDGSTFGDLNMVLELPSLLGLAAFSALAHLSLRRFEDENLLAGAMREDLVGVDLATGVYEERLLRPALDSELSRSRRFNREFAIVLIGVDEMRQRFDYRDEQSWRASFTSTAHLLRGTRTNIDRVYRYGETAFALLLPESGEREVRGLVRRLRRVSKRTTPPEGEPGGPLPTHFGATFFPQCATSVDDLLRRAEVALRIAERNPNHLQFDSAEAPGQPDPETLRRLPVQPVINARTPIAATSAPADTAVRAEAPELPEGPLSDAVPEILKRMDETLDLIRSLRNGQAA